MLEAEKEQLIRVIFSDREMFEQYILNVKEEADRQEISEILSRMMIRTLLRDELNFLYMQNIKNFNFRLVVNLLFKEFASEWVSYAEDTLGLSKDEALVEIHDKNRVHFLLSISRYYFKKYKTYYVEHIADSFIELIDTMPNTTLNNELIKYVLKSGFVRRNSINTVYSYNELWHRVKNAQNNKNNQQIKLQIIIDDISKSKELDKLKQYEYEAQSLEERPLAYFDDAIMYLRETMIEFMLHIDKITIR